MRVLLVNPIFPPSLWDFAGSRDLEGSRYAHPPLALPTVAALTPRPHVVTCVDENVEEIDLDTPADVVGLTGYYIQRERLFALADAFRARGRRVCIGGPIVEESTIDECLRHADHVFRGEAEYTWPRFFDDLAAGRAERIYRQAELVDLRDSPLPRFELLRLERYSTTTIETSRGCPYSCEFCEIPSRLGKRARVKSVAQVMAEVRALHLLGADSIFIVDDHFVGNRRHAMDVLQAIARFVRDVEHRVALSCQFTINLARDEELLEAMHAANIRRVFVGLETPRRESLLEVRKKQNVIGDVVENVRRVQAHNIMVWAGLIVGFDHDDPRVFDEQLRFLDELAVPVAMIGLLQAIPGTPLHARMERDGRLRETDMAGVRGAIESLVRTNIRPVGMSDTELVGGYQRLVRTLVEPERFGARLVDAICAGERPIPKAKGALTRRNLLTLARTARYYLLSSDARARQMAVRVIREVARRRPDDLATAIMHLVVYKHLRAFYEEVAALPMPRPQSSSVATNSPARSQSTITRPTSKVAVVSKKELA